MVIKRNKLLTIEVSRLRTEKKQKQKKTTFAEIKRILS